MNDYLVNVLRLLSIEMVEEANSGHPGMPMGCASMMYILWFKIMNHNPCNPNWFNRDRFILSNGHGCALLYSCLHLSGYKITLDDLKKFRQIGSITPGHPEKNLTPGVELTTGPLGQGFANGVGMSIVSKKLENQYNTKDNKIIDHNIYVMCGDGCLMEGITNEAASIAGHLKLNNLIVLYDDNKITIDGSTDLTFTEDVTLRFQALGWDVFEIKDGNTDLKNIENTIIKAKKSDKPSLIRVKTDIGYLSNKQGNCKSHGAPLGEEEVQRLRKLFGFEDYKSFEFPKKLLDEFKKTINKGNKLETEWENKLMEYKLNEFEKYNKLIKIFDNKIYEDIQFPKFDINDKKIATRDISGKCMQKMSAVLDNLVIGSADLSPSNRTLFSNNIISKDNYNGIYIHYGVREHAMAAIANGISTYGYLPIIATFLGFINYFLASIRLSALSKHKVIYILTHDSVALGEDGPTHQPIESLTILRSIPDLLTFRPADGNETNIAYNLSLQNDGPSCICLARQTTSQLPNKDKFEDIKKGGYILYQNCEDTQIKLIIISTGSEVSSVLSSIIKYNLQNIRLVSLPCLELFEKQDIKYKQQILPKNIKKISFEAGSTLGWHKYADFCFGIDEFGKSGKGSDVLKYFSLDEEGIYKIIKNHIEIDDEDKI